MAVEVVSTSSAVGWRPGFWKLIHLMALLAPIALGTLFGLLEWLSVPVGFSFLGFMLGVLLAVVGAAVGLLMIPFAGRRGLNTVLCCVLLFAGILVGGRLQDVGRMQAFASCAERAKPLIAAIERYREDHGRAPGELWDLVPVYLDTIPGTGLRAYPDWDYGEKQGEAYELVVHCSLFLSFDTFVYWPSGRCPADYYGGSPERIGAWVYVHE